jgi:hypothetical protein
MSKAVIGASQAVMAGDSHRPTQEEVRRQLEAILASPAFHGSKRCQQFLEYVCEKSLAGLEGTLKERTVAVEVFGRPPESDLGEDTIVRVGAREVRKRLAQYYVTPEGAAAEVRIDLHSGTYAPDFRYAVIKKEPEVAPVPAPLPAPARKFTVRTAIWVAAVAVVLGAAAVAYSRWPGSSANEKLFRTFWQPAFRSTEPLLVAVAHPIVYHPSWRASKLNEEVLGPPSPLGQRVLQVPPKSLSGSDMIPVINQYVGFGDLVVSTELASMLSRHNRSVRVRLASSVEFADLRKTDAFLIGAITNRWTMEFQKQWRFQFSRSPDLRTIIVDASTPGRQWQIPMTENGSAPEDYVLICRISNSVTGGMVLVGAGLKQFGTEAAGHLLTDQDQLAAILRKLPAGWESKNMQVVLRAQIIGNTPAQPEMVASHVW